MDHDHKQPHLRRSQVIRIVLNISTIDDSASRTTATFPDPDMLRYSVVRHNTRNHDPQHLHTEKLPNHVIELFSLLLGAKKSGVAWRYQRSASTNPRLSRFALGPSEYHIAFPTTPICELLLRRSRPVTRMNKRRFSASESRPR